MHHPCFGVHKVLTHTNWPCANSEVMMRVVAELANTSTWCEHNVLVLSTWMKVPTMGTGFNFGWLVGVWQL